MKLTSKKLLHIYCYLFSNKEFICDIPYDGEVLIEREDVNICMIDCKLSLGMWCGYVVCDLWGYCMIDCKLLHGIFYGYLGCEVIWLSIYILQWESMVNDMSIKLFHRPQKKKIREQFILKIISSLEITNSNKVLWFILNFYWKF